VWCDLDAHRALFHDKDGTYAGCTVPHRELGPSNYAYRDGLPRPVAPIDTAA
jgi:hypothetical protein